jgi:hypothetical protein
LLQDGKVLLGLGHHPLVSRDHEKREVDARGAGDHRPHEVFVPWNIYHARYSPTPKIERGKVEVDRDLAASFLGQPIHRPSGERRNQGGLAMVYVSRCADDHAAVQDR